MNTAEYLFEQAVMTIRAGRRDEALDMLAEVVRLLPSHCEAWGLRARLESEAGRQFNAMLHHAIATQLQPDNYGVWINRGIDAMGARMFKESKESFEKSIALKPSYEAHFNYGNLLSAMMLVDEAVHHFKAAEKIGGVLNQQIYANLGVAMIAQGKWHEGFNYYRHRFNAPGFPPRPRFNYPIWHGEPLAGKTILLYVEQGLGDEIMSLRFALPVMQTGARVIVSVRPPMFRLARTFAEKIGLKEGLILQYDPTPWEPDYMCALLDVPAYIDFDPVPGGLPLSEGYLSPEDRGFKLEFPPGLRVGICWASGKRELQPEIRNVASAKSLSLRQFLPLKREGVVLVNLQKEHNDRDTLRDNGIFDPMVGTTDFMDTAWIIDQLDLVVTVDTSVAHLAGALGKPVWNLVRFDAMWPWMKESGKTCWYDNMTIYRQPAPFDWNEPLKRLMADFDALVMEKRQNEAKAA